MPSNQFYPTRHSLAVGLLFVLLAGCQFDLVYSLKMKQVRLSPTFTLSFVYGDQEAMKSHMDALEYCRSLGGPRADAEVAYQPSGASKNSSPSPSSSPAEVAGKPGSSSTDAQKSTSISNTTPASQRTVTDFSGREFRSDLLSLHDGHMVNDLMRFVLKEDRRQFWIGGVVKMVADEFHEGHPRQHLIQMWTDRTPANFRFLHFENPELDHMRAGDVRCLSVDYASGKWGVHDCAVPMYFVCETIELTRPPSDQAPATVSNSAVRTTETTPTTLATKKP